METFPRYWPFVRGNPPVTGHHKGHWRCALMFSLICWTNGWVKIKTPLIQVKTHHSNYDVTVMYLIATKTTAKRTYKRQMCALHLGCYLVNYTHIILWNISMNFRVPFFFVLMTKHYVINSLLPVHNHSQYGSIHYWAALCNPPQE